MDKSLLNFTDKINKKSGTVQIIKLNSLIKEISVKKFIEDVLINQIGTLIDQGFHYFAFILICQGIEYLGNFYDPLDFDNHNMSGNRFKIALSRLFKNSFYKHNLTWLYENLRCNIVHQIRPSGDILLTSNSLNGCPLRKHLRLENDKRIFVIEVFYNDFCKACYKLLKKFETGKFINLSGKAKFSETYLNIFNINSSSDVVEVTGGTVGYVRSA